MQQLVQFLITDTEEQRKLLEDKFQLRRDRKHVWLQKIALWVLMKLKCNVIETNKVTVKRTLDTDDFVQRLWKQQTELFKTYHYRGSRLLVGHEEFNQMQGFPINHPLSICMQYVWNETVPDMKDPFKSIRTANDMHVTVIPWMKGFLVLPKYFIGEEHRRHRGF